MLIAWYSIIYKTLATNVSFWYWIVNKFNSLSAIHCCRAWARFHRWWRSSFRRNDSSSVCQCSLSLGRSLSLLDQLMSAVIHDDCSSYCGIQQCYCQTYGQTNDRSIKTIIRISLHTTHIKTAEQWTIIQQYSDCTQAVDGWAATFGTATRALKSFLIGLEPAVWFP